MCNLNDSKTATIYSNNWPKVTLRPNYHDKYDPTTQGCTSEGCQSVLNCGGGVSFGGTCNVWFKCEAGSTALTPATPTPTEVLKTGSAPTAGFAAGVAAATIAGVLLQA